MSEVNKETQQDASANGVEVEQIKKRYRLRTLAEKERQHIMRTIKFFKGNKTHAAKSLGISQKTLYNKLDDYNLRKQFVKESSKKVKQEVQG